MPVQTHKTNYVREPSPVGKYLQMR